MPLNFSRRLTGRARSVNANRHLGFTLAFIAGAINAGGFLAVHQYTSHMTGIVSSMADNAALGMFDAAFAGLGVLASFIIGAGCSAILVTFARRRNMHSEFALPLMVEAALLLCFGLMGTRLETIDGFSVSLTVTLLAFIMGLQNAVITKLSNAEIRTTHVTGIVTDIGIELGKFIYRSAEKHVSASPVTVNWQRLRVLTWLAASFFVGGVAGALGFHHVGYVATVPLALCLVALTSMPLIDDLMAHLHGKW